MEFFTPSSSSRPPSPDRRRIANLWVTGGFLCLVAALTCLFIANPAASHLFPPCPFRLLTGLYCPGCGSLRAIHLFLHGHLLAAFRMNPILVLAIPGAGVLLLKRSLAYKVWTPWVALIILVAYGVLRNIPVVPFSFMAPK